MKNRKWYIILLLGILTAFLTGCASTKPDDISTVEAATVNPEDKSKDEVIQLWYELKDYPVLADNGKWDHFDYTDTVEICNPPKDMLDDLSSPELARLLLRYPFLNQDIGYDHIDMLFDFISANNRAYDELLARPDGVLSLIRAYEENVLDVDQINKQGAAVPFDASTQAETFIFEFITYYQDELSEEERAQFLTAYEQKNEKYYSELSNENLKKAWKVNFSVEADADRNHKIYTISELGQWKDKWYELRDYPDPLAYAPSGYFAYNFDWDEYRELMNPPKDLLESFSTEELADLLLRYYDIRYLPDYDDIDALFGRLEAHCDILNELLAREDGIEGLLRAYEKNEMTECPASQLSGAALRNGYPTVMAELFACRFIDYYQDRFTEEDIALYREIYQSKKKIYATIPISSVYQWFPTVFSD